jgi:hypothetical protein
MVRRLVPAVLAALALQGCGTTDPAPRGVVQGIVLVEGNAIPGVTVELTGPLSRTATTDPSGRYSFDEIPAGAYVVSVRGAPPDAAFPATSRSAVVPEGGTVTVDFQGNFIRTASISGTVTSGGRGIGGITVQLRGAANASAQTDSSGSFGFPGLRAGSYEVEITQIPSFLSFPSTRTSVDLATGQDHVVTFEGRAEVTASAVIQSVTRTLPSGETEPVDPGNVQGRVEVTVTLDRGEDVPDSLLVLLGDQVVGKQTFLQGVGASAEPDGPAQAPMELVFAVNTASFDPESGVPRNLNGETALAVRLATREGGPAAWTASIPVVLQNVDTVTGHVTGGRGPEEDPDGRVWWGGDLSVRVVPVVYQPEREVTAVEVVLRHPGVGNVARVPVLGQAPFTAVFPEEAEVTGSLAGYQTTSEEGDELRVTSARYADGGSVPGLPILLADGLRLDLVPPDPIPFGLPRQSDAQDCCLQNWVGAGLSFVEVVGTPSDAGVGGARATIHVGEAGLTDAEIAGQAEVTHGEDLPPSAGNTAYRAVAVLSDALGNQRVVPLEPTEGNPLANDRGAVFGVDLSRPEGRLDPDGAGVGPIAINPPAGSRWVLQADPGEAGLGPSPARTTVHLLAPGVSGDDSCIIPGPGPCEPVLRTLTETVPSSPPGYMTFRSRVLDRGGNASEVVEARVLRDTSPPQVDPPTHPAALQGGVLRSFASTARDDVDLHLGQVGIRFGDGSGPALPFAPPDTLGRPFDGDLVTLADFTVRFPFVKGLEHAAGSASEGGIPDGELQPAVALQAEAADAAGNRGWASTPVLDAGGSSLQGFGEESRGGDGVRRWGLEASATQVCRPDLMDGTDEAECADGVPSSLSITAWARGPAQEFSRPFEAVHLLAVGETAHRWLGATADAELVSLGSGPEGREWRWQITWRPPPDMPTGPLRLLVAGVDGEGMALLSPELDGIQVVGIP